MIGFLYAIVSMIGFSFSQIFNKKLTLKIDSYNTYLLREFYLIILLFISSILLVRGFTPLTNNSSLLILIAAFIGLLSYVCLLKSYYHIPLGIAIIVANIAPFFTLIASIAFESLYPTFTQFITMIIVLFGIFITVFDKSNYNIKKYKFILLPFITAIGWGFYFYCAYLLSKQNIHPINISLYIEFITLIVLFLYLFSKKRIDIRIFKRENLYYGFLSGLFSLLGLIFSIYSMMNINPAISMSIISAQVILITLLSHILFKEKLSIRQWIGIFIVFVGLVLFNFV